MNFMLKSALFLFLVIPAAQQAVAQVAIGAQPFGSFTGGPDLINLGNLNANLTIPIRHKAGRGQNFIYDLQYNSSVYFPVQSNGTSAWQPDPNWGWSGLSQAGVVYEGYSQSYSSGTCGQSGQNSWQSWSYSGFVYFDNNGVRHTFGGVSGSYVSSDGAPPTCPPTGANPSGVLTSQAGDGSGLSVQFYTDQNGFHATIYTSKGEAINPPVRVNFTSPAGTLTLTDQNGNQITSNNGTFTDTLGQQALVVLGTAPSNTILKYTNSLGAYVSHTVSYTSKNIKTNFGCNVAEYSANGVYLVDKITLPDGRYYQFNYESTPGYSGYYTGRVASIRLPGGGSITYQYTGSNNGIVCTDGSTAGLTRTVSDGTTSQTWKYSRSFSTPNWSTVSTAPSYGSPATQDDTVYTFLNGYVNPTFFYEIKRQTYAGSRTTGTLTQTVLHCYDVGYCDPTKGDTNTSVAGISITPIMTSVQWPDKTGITSGTLDQSDSVGNLTSHSVYDFGTAGSGSYSTTPIQTTTYTYWTNPSNSAESSFPSEIVVKDGSGATISDTKYVYDKTAAVPTSGTPQHVSPPTGSRGNLTSVQRWVSASSSSWPTTIYTNFDTGNPQTVMDANLSNVTTYTYGNCGNSFLTHTSTPVKNPAGTVTATLTTSAAWNCVGGVQTSTTDYNNNITTYNYGSDPYWRPVSATDEGTNTVSYSYPDSSSPNTSSVSSTFNGGSSIIDVVTTTDGLGRAKVQQRRQGPSASNYDSVATSYDSHGRQACQTAVPYSAASGAYTAPTSSTGVCTTYDALNRPVSSTDAGGGTAAYTYTPNSSLLANYTLVTLGPAPTNENTKRRLLGYNGAGQLTSVCEVTSLGGSGSCGASTLPTGYLTQYTYDGPNLMKTQQNVQAVPSDTQTRTINAYDGLGRILSETIPEWSAGNGVPGTTTYVYDTDSTCGSTSTGDLIKKTDNAGNVICNTYDSLHRLLTSTVKSGTYASNTPTSNFVYDAASYSGTAMQNAKGNLAEAYTGSSASKTTDLYFSSSYSTSGATLGGVVAKVWEMTPHSTGYFLTTDTSYPNGALGSRSASWGAPSVSYGLDGEGRPNTATDTTHTINLVTSASYNTAGSATGVSYGNGDSDSFTYDPKTNRPATLVSSITGSNPYSMTTTLTWNANASLAQMQIADTLDSSKNQTCNYSADDLRRIASVDCGVNIWAQNFTYSAFGNIKKANAGNATSYQVAYNDITNQVKGGPAYDANGNQLSSTGLQTIGWNAAGNAVTVMPQSGSTVTGTYDALNRLVETSSTSGYAEFVYGAAGDKAGRVNGSAFHDATVALPGGEHAVYNAGGFDFFAHTDWLGSARLSTLWAHGVYSKESYAPFGEIYNESGANIDRNFTGHDQSEVTGPTASGTYESWFRKYDPAAGRWLSPDPLGWGSVNIADPQSLDRYAYVENQPLNATDPSGLTYCQSSDGFLWDMGPTNGCPDGWAYYMTSPGAPVGPAPPPWVIPPPDCSDFGDCQQPNPGNPGSPGQPGAGGGGTPWYKSCGAKAAGSFLLHGSIDALGVIPGEGAAVEAVQFGGGLVATAWSLSDRSPIGQVGTGFGVAGVAVGLASKPSSLKTLASIAGTSVKSVAELIPGIGQAVAIGSVLWDGVTALQEYAECSEQQH